MKPDPPDFHGLWKTREIPPDMGGEVAIAPGYRPLPTEFPATELGKTSVKPVEKKVRLGITCPQERSPFPTFHSLLYR